MINKQITLSRGMFCIVDLSTYKLISGKKWYAHKCGNKFYAARDEKVNGKKKCIYMHRLIMDSKKGEEIDHINGNSLDNRKSNLRKASHSENNRNKGLTKNNKSGYKGVYFEKQTNKWRACIHLNNHKIPLGRFIKIEDAINAYNQGAKKYHGEFTYKQYLK